MNREKLKLIVRNLESLVECLKEEIKNYLTDYDEVFYDGDEEDYAR